MPTISLSFGQSKLPDSAGVTLNAYHPAVLASSPSPTAQFPKGGCILTKVLAVGTDFANGDTVVVYANAVKNAIAIVQNNATGAIITYTKAAIGTGFTGSKFTFTAPNADVSVTIFGEY